MKRLCVNIYLDLNGHFMLQHSRVVPQCCPPALDLSLLGNPREELIALRTAHKASNTLNPGRKH